MASEPKGKIVVPVWVDAGVVKALVNDAGKMPCDIDGQTVDIDGQAVVVSGSVDANIAGQSVDISGEDVLAYLHGYDGSTWRRLPLLWGYSAIWDENLSGVVTGTTYAASTAAIPDGELRILQGVTLRNATTAGSNMTVYISRASGAQMILKYMGSAVAYAPVFIGGQFVLRAGDVVWVDVTGAQANDTIQAGVLGYTMKVAL